MTDLTVNCLMRSFAHISDQKEMMRTLTELNSEFLLLHKSWSTMQQHSRPIEMSEQTISRLRILNEDSQRSIAANGSAVFSLSSDFLSGNGELLGNDNFVIRNRQLNYAALAFAQRIVRFDSTFGSIVLSCTVRECSMIGNLSISEMSDLCEREMVIPLHTLPPFTPDITAGARYHTSRLYEQLTATENAG